MADIMGLQKSGEKGLWVPRWTWWSAGSVTEGEVFPSAMCATVQRSGCHPDVAT